MKPLPDWARPFKLTTAFASLSFSCSARCLSCKLMALVLLWLLTGFTSLYAQPTLQWDNDLGGTGDDQLVSVRQTRDGGYIVGGTSDSPISGDKAQDSRGSRDYWVVKLDASGKKVWEKTFGGSGHDDLVALQQTRDGGYILGGTSDSPASGDKTQSFIGVCEEAPYCPTDFWIVKLDAAGKKQWDKTVGGSEIDWLEDIEQTRDGGYIVGGTSYSGISGDKTEASKGENDYWVVKLDKSGKKQWDKTIGGSEIDRLADLQQTKDGGYILGGTSGSKISGDKTEDSRGGEDFADYWVVKLDKNGKKQWDKTLGGSEDEGLSALQQTKDGGYILGGNSPSPVSGDKTEALNCADDGPLAFSAWVVKLNKNGKKQWDRVYGNCPGSETAAFDVLDIIVQTQEGGYLFGGRTGFLGNQFRSYFNFWLVKLNGAGNQEWETSIGGRFDELLTDLQQTRDGGFILGGYSNSPASFDKTEDNIEVCEEDENENIACSFDYWVVKLAPFPKGGQVKSFTLINAQSEQPIGPLQDGDELSLAGLPAKLNVRANTLPARVGSVRFKLRGAQNRDQLENEVPYALFGDTRGDYNTWYPPAGSYTLTATPYAKRRGKGSAGTPLTIRFTVVNQPAGVAAEASPTQRIPAPQATRPDLAPRLTLYPNPTDDGRLQVQLADPIQGQVRYRLLSPVGQKLAEGSLELPQAANLLELDFSGQIRSVGVYYLRLEGSNLQQTLRIMRR